MFPPHLISQRSEFLKEHLKGKVEHWETLAGRAAAISSLRGDISLELRVASLLSPCNWIPPCTGDQVARLHRDLTPKGPLHPGLGLGPFFSAPRKVRGRNKNHFTVYPIFSRQPLSLQCFWLD